MLRVVNQTPFATQVVPALDRERRDMLVVVVKGTFALPRSEGADAAVSDEQAPITLADEHFGDVASSSVRYESDLAPGKPGTDVIMNATAYAPAAGIDALVVTLQAGSLSKSVRVVGQRQWSKDMMGRHRPSAPARFTTMPLVYERAFGGAEPRNPVGVGVVAQDAAPKSDDRLPNLEDPAQPLQLAGERPPPTSFGVVHRSWTPRAAFSGTCDEAWRRSRAPFLPDDFDPRYHLSASPGLSSANYFLGGETVRANNVRPGGLPLAFRVPRRNPSATIRLRGKDVPCRLVLDTIVVEPDLERVLCTWRGAASCPRALLQIDRIKISEVGPS